MGRTAFGLLLGMLLAVSALAGLGGCGREDDGDFYARRPAQGGPHLFDRAGILADVEDYAEAQLAAIHQDYALEAVIVSVEALPPGRDASGAALDLMNNWGVGRDTGGRGLLLLLDNGGKHVRLEVSYELEDVFTDAFCGHAADKQLAPRFFSGRLGEGLLAVMEEVERRARIKWRGGYDAADIRALDVGLVSGGGGAETARSDFGPGQVLDAAGGYPAGATPRQAWETLKQAWRDKVRDPDLGVYTRLGRLAFRDHAQQLDAQLEEQWRTYADKPYEVLSDGAHAAIFFGTDQGWDNAPFLFTKTEGGWSFDLVCQRRFVRLGRSPQWGIERADYPHVDLLSSCPWWMRQDIPLEGDDVYSVARDASLARDILRLEAQLAARPDDWDALMGLGRLYAVTALGAKALPLLSRAGAARPDRPEPRKYLGIVHVDAYYQFDKAAQELERFVDLAPDDVFGRNFLGWVLLCLDRPGQAAEQLERAVALRPDNCYAWCKLARAHARMGDQDKARQMFDLAGAVATPDPRRLAWLARDLAAAGMPGPGRAP